jgi:LmbE family N-acetylglucosaminyl deacetylase
MTKPVAMAIVAHPDDVEFMMAGTMGLLGQAGYELHVMNIANGSGGSLVEDAATISARRFREAQRSAEIMGATLHPPIANDMEVFYNDALLRKVTAVIREVRPTIILTQPPRDYMEDHMNSCRLAVSAAFARGIPNYVSDPPVPAIPGEVTIYHALPWGLRYPLGECPWVTHYVDVHKMLDFKRETLAAHESQRAWLDETQGMGSYIDKMVEVTRQMGIMSGRFEYAEGFTRHMYMGYCDPSADPLRDALGLERVHLIHHEPRIPVFPPPL